MASGSSSEVLRQFRTLFEAGAIGSVPDGELIDRFADRRDEAAFTALVERHGPMVLRVCRGVLGDAHDAQDAFQATFLVLARKAGSIRKRDSVGPWLHGVACRVSARAKGHAARRRAHDRRVAERAAPPSALDADPSWMWAELHEEVDRLPERYRAAVVLCYLEGLSNEEAAGRLRWPVGTVKVRLSRAREKLKVRLTRRGLAPAVGLLGAASAADAKASIPAALVELTVRAASGRAMTGVVAASVISLTEGALRTMMLTKLKLTALGMLSVAAVTVGAGSMLGQDGSKPGPNAASVSGKAAPDVAPGGEDIEAIKKRLLAATRQKLEEDQKYYEDGRITPNRLLDSMERLLAAQEQVAATKPERRAALEDYIRRAEQLLRDAQAELARASGPKSDIPDGEKAGVQRNLKLDVSEIQIRLDAARLKLAEESDAARSARAAKISKESTRTKAETAALRESMLVDAHQIMNDTYRLFKGGEINVLPLLNADDQLVEAELRAAATDGDRLAVRKGHVERLERFLRDVEAQHKADQATRADVARIRLQTNAAKLHLLDQATASGPADPRASGDQPGNGPHGDNDAGPKTKPPARFKGSYVVEPPDLLIVEVLEALPGRPISGERLVRPDGTISLGFYGDLDVAGLTLPEVKEKIVRHLRKFLSDETLGLEIYPVDDAAPNVKPVPDDGRPVPASDAGVDDAAARNVKLVPVAPKDTDRVFVDVSAWNSKVYYVGGDVAAPGRFPITGNETVLDAIHFAGNPVTTRGTKVRLVRRGPAGQPDVVMPVDYEQITGGTDRSTNYELMPGDRIVVNRQEPETNSPRRADPDRAEGNAEGHALEQRLNALESKLDRVINLLDRKEPDKGPTNYFNRKPGGTPKR